MKATIKSFKKVLIKSTALLLLAMTIGEFSACNTREQGQDIDIIDIQQPQTTEEAYNNLKKVTSIKMPTYEDTYKDPDGVRRKYNFVYEEDVLSVSAQLSIAIEDYFKACGASDWADPNTEQFWTEDVEYIVAAMAFKESCYRTNSTNDERDCVGLVGINEELLLPTLEQWLTLPVWEPTYPNVEFDSTKVDMFNPTTSLEYTYYNMGYNLVNRFQKGKRFYDEKTQSELSVWDKLEYSPQLQIKLVIASHLFGLDNVIDSVFERNYDEYGKLIPLSRYINSEYVNTILEKTEDLKSTYNVNYVN